MITTSFTELEIKEIGKPKRTEKRGRPQKDPKKQTNPLSNAEKIIALRNQYKHELHNLQSADPEVILILQAKIIALGQALDEIGCHDYDKTVDDTL